MTTTSNPAPTPLPDVLRVESIQTREQADTWIKALYEHGLLFHFDDPVEDILNLETGERIFAAEDYDFLRARIKDLFNIPDYDPFAAAVPLIQAELESNPPRGQEQPAYIPFKRLIDCSHVAIVIRADTLEMEYPREYKIVASFNRFDAMPADVWQDMIHQAFMTVCAYHKHPLVFPAVIEYQQDEQLWLDNGELIVVTF